MKCIKCNKTTAHYNYENSIEPNHCKKCKSDDMIKIKIIRPDVCVTCKTVISFF
jgi:hypothetical protein